jgi:hypothetical protein
MNDWGNACLGEPLRADRRRSRRLGQTLAGRSEGCKGRGGNAFGIVWHYAVSVTSRRMHPSVHYSCSRTGKDGPDVTSNQPHLRMILSHAYQLY